MPSQEMFCGSHLVFILAHGSPNTYREIDVSLVYIILIQKKLRYYPTQDASDHQTDHIFGSEFWYLGCLDSFQFFQMIVYLRAPNVGPLKCQH